MPKNTWRNGLAVGLGIGIPIGVLLVFSGDVFRYFGDCIAHTECGKYSPSKENRNEPNWWPLARRFISPSDTLAQWIMAFFSILAVGLIWRTLIQTNKTNIAAVKAADAALEANRIMREDQRPWITASAVSCLFEVGKNGEVTASLEVNFSNIGHSPAKNVKFHSAGNYGGRNFPAAAYETLKKGFISSNVDSGLILFPEQSKTISFGLNTSRVDFSVEPSFGNMFNIVFAISYSHGRNKGSHFAQSVGFAIPEGLKAAIRENGNNYRATSVRKSIDGQTWAA